MKDTHHTSSFDSSPVALLYDRYASVILHVVARYARSQEDAHYLVLEVFIAAMENQIWIHWSEGE